MTFPYVDPKDQLPEDWVPLIDRVINRKKAELYKLRSRINHHQALEPLLQPMITILKEEITIFECGKKGMEENAGCDNRTRHSRNFGLHV